MKNFKKSTGKILLASGLVVSMSACSVTNSFSPNKFVTLQADIETTNPDASKILPVLFLKFFIEKSYEEFQKEYR
jgi:hypothetical protein